MRRARRRGWAWIVIVCGEGLRARGKSAAYASGVPRLSICLLASASRVGSSIVASLRGAYRNRITSGSLASTLKDSAVKNCDTLLLASYGLEAA